MVHPLLALFTDLKCHRIYHNEPTVVNGTTAVFNVDLRSNKIYYLCFVNIRSDGTFQLPALALNIDGVPYGPLVPWPSAANKSLAFLGNFFIPINYDNAWNTPIGEWAEVPVRKNITISVSNTDIAPHTVYVDLYAFVHEDPDNEFEAPSSP